MRNFPSQPTLNTKLLFIIRKDRTEVASECIVYDTNVFPSSSLISYVIIANGFVTYLQEKEQSQCSHLVNNKQRNEKRSTALQELKTVQTAAQQMIQRFTLSHLPFISGNIDQQRETPELVNCPIATSKKNSGTAAPIKKIK